MNNIQTLKLAEVDSTIAKKIDVFICSSSYEDRCKSIVETISKNKIEKALMVENLDFDELIKTNGNKIREILGDKLQGIEIRTKEPLFTADNLKNSLIAHISREPQQFLIDITTFNREALLILVRLLRQLCKSSDSINFIYTSAKEYSVNEKDSSDKWLSKGIEDIRTVLGYPGENLPSRQVHLIVLAGFEPSRALGLIEKYEPAIASIGYGAKGTSTEKEHHSLNVQFFDQIKTELSKIENFTFYSDNPYETKRLVDEQIRKFPDFNSVVAPMNTKLSTLGVALAAFENEALQICYAQPHLYNYDGYSIPGDKCYYFSLDGMMPKD